MTKRDDERWRGNRWNGNRWNRANRTEAAGKREANTEWWAIRNSVVHAHGDVKPENVLKPTPDEKELNGGLLVRISVSRAEAVREIEAHLTNARSILSGAQQLLEIVRPDPSKRIATPPGSLLRTVSEFLFSKKTLEHVVHPIIADMQAEYFEALVAKRPYKAFWIRVRGYWSLAKAVGLYSLLKAVVEMWRKVS